MSCGGLGLAEWTGSFGGDKTSCISWLRIAESSTLPSYHNRGSCDSDLRPESLGVCSRNLCL